MSTAQKLWSFAVSSGIVLALLGGLVSLYRAHVEHGMQILEMQQRNAEQVEMIKVLNQQIWRMNVQIKANEIRLETVLDDH